MPHVLCELVLSCVMCHVTCHVLCEQLQQGSPLCVLQVERE